MKKNWTILLCAALLCALCACGGQTAQVEPPPAQDAGEPAVQNAPAPAEPELPQEDEAPTGTTGEDQPESAPAPAQAEPPVQNTPKAAAPASAEAVTSPVQTKTPQEQPAPKPEPESAPESKPSPEPGPAPQPESKPDPAPEPEPMPEPTPEPAPEPEPAPATDRKAVAQGLVGHPVSELYAAIGRPISADYAPSCLVLDGEDGELVYDGFTVYTEKGPDYETVYAVF